MSKHLFFLSSVFKSVASHVEQWDGQWWDPAGLLPLVIKLLAKPDPGLGGVSALDMLGLFPTPLPLPPSLPLPSPRRSSGSSAPPLTWPLPCWLAKSRSSLLKSMAPGPPLRRPLQRHLLPNPLPNPMPSLPLPLLPPLLHTLCPLPLPWWKSLLHGPLWSWPYIPLPLVLMFPWQSIEPPRRLSPTSMSNSLMPTTLLPCLLLGGQRRTP